MEVFISKSIGGGYNMKILLVNGICIKDWLDYSSPKLVGAVELQIFALAEGLKRRGHEPIIVRPWRGNKKYEELKGIKFINIRFPGPDKRLLKRPLEAVRKGFKTFLYSWELKNIIEKVNPDIITASNTITAYFLPKPSAKYKTIFITHNHDVFIEKDVYSHIRKYMLKKISHKVDAIVCLTKAIKKHLNTVCNINTNIIIPNTIKTEEYRNNGDSNYILNASKLLKHKRVDVLVKAFSNLIKEKKDLSAKLIIIGEGPYKKRLNDLVKFEGLKERVVFLPFQPVLIYREYLSKCSIFVLPSEIEAFGVVIIEAMASGKPVIASDIPGPQDIITHGKDGFLFEKENVDELKRYLEIILEDKELRKRIGENARKTVGEKYTIEKVADSYLKLYEELLSGGHGK